jgi:hypothetical protein
MAFILVERNAELPLSLTIRRAGVGGITGLSPTVALRRATTAGSYLDWDDGTFKGSGWSTKYASLTEAERGHYVRTLDLSGVPGATAGLFMLAEYRVDNGGDVVGDAQDVVSVVTTNTDTILLRKALTNRMEESPGNPGTLILNDDDDMTPLINQQLRDFAGDATIGVQGSPARRTKAS